MLSEQQMEDIHTEIVIIGPLTIVKAWIGDLYLGERTYSKTGPKKAKKSALTYIRINGSLN